MSLNKRDFGYMVVYLDMVVVLSLTFFANWLERSINEYTEAFKDQTIEMDDFGIRFGNMPVDKQFGSNF